jgi:hypothetical protein
VIELTARMPNHGDATDNRKNGARAKLNAWQRAKAQTTQEYVSRVENKLGKAYSEPAADVRSMVAQIKKSS